MKRMGGFGLKGMDNEKVKEALHEILDRIELAMENGYYVEAITLEHQLIEYMLGARLIVIRFRTLSALKFHENPDVSIILEKGVEYNYARLNDLCFFFGAYDKEIHEWLKRFNTERVNAVHKFIKRPREYAELKRSAEMGRDIVYEFLTPKRDLKLLLSEQAPITSPVAHRGLLDRLLRGFR